MANWTKKTWTTSDYVNPENMNHLEDGIEEAMESGGNTGVEMTYAEYQALTDEEKNDGTVRMIPDYPEGSTFIDDSADNTTRVWSSHKSKQEVTAINNKFGKYFTSDYELLGSTTVGGEWVTIDIKDYKVLNIIQYSITTTKYYYALNDIVFKDLITFENDYNYCCLGKCANGNDINVRVQNNVFLISTDGINDGNIVVFGIAK